MLYTFYIVLLKQYFESAKKIASREPIHSKEKYA